MNSRRGFFASLAGAAAIALDPERALWVPGKKFISVPAPRYSLGLAIGDLVCIDGRWFTVSRVAEELIREVQLYPFLANGSWRPAAEVRRERDLTWRNLEAALGRGV